MNKAFVMIACLAAVACGAASEEEFDESGDDVVTAESEARASLAFTVTTFSAPGNKGSTETRRLFKTAAEFKSYFGVTATSAGLNFSREWVIFYSAGTKTTGGFAASVKSITVSNTGKTMYVTTALESPGQGCMVTTALTKPNVLVKFRKPSVTPISLQATRNDSVRNCDRLTCAAVLCAPGTICDESSGEAECVEAPSLDCRNAVCAVGFHCTVQQVFCIRSPCPPLPTCIPDGETCDRVNCAGDQHCTTRNGLAVCVSGPTCALMRCAAGTYCSDSAPEGAACRPYSTCMNVRCTTSTHCEDIPSRCAQGTCPPSSPSCVPNR